MTTVFVQRDTGKVIVGVYANPQPGYAVEAIADDHADVVAFRNPPAPAPKTAADKLKAIGLTVSELKQILGL